MAEQVSDFIIGRLQAWGITRIFGYSGDGNNGLMGALNRAEGAIDFIQPRHEEMAAFMACGHAKFTGEVGICMATSGPGAIHLLNGLYDAKKDHVPVVAIVGQQARTALGGEYQQEVDLATQVCDVSNQEWENAATHALFRDYYEKCAARWSVEETEAEAARHEQQIRRVRFLTGGAWKIAVVSAVVVLGAAGWLVWRLMHAQPTGILNAVALATPVKLPPPPTPQREGPDLAPLKEVNHHQSLDCPGPCV